VKGSEPIRFAVLIFPNFPLMAFSSIIEPLRAANTLSGRKCYSWITVAAGEKIKASNGIGIEPDFHVRRAPEVDRIVVCSGGDAEHLVADEEMAWIRKNLRAGAELGAIADAAFFLARKGLLDGHACTLHWTSQPAFQEAFPHLDMRSDLFVIDRRRFTRRFQIEAPRMDHAPACGGFTAKRGLEQLPVIVTRGGIERVLILPNRRKCFPLRDEDRRLPLRA